MIGLSLGDWKLATLTNLCVLFQIIHLVTVLSVIRNKNNPLVVSLDIKKMEVLNLVLNVYCPKISFVEIRNSYVSLYPNIQILDDSNVFW